MLAFVSAPGEAKGPHRVPGADELPRATPGPGPGEFCTSQRADWLGYALSLAGNWPDAEDAVQHAAEKIIRRYAKHGTLCPAGYDNPVAYSKKMIANYIRDLYRRRKIQLRHSRSLLPTSAGDIADDVLDRMLAKDVRDFVESLKPVERWIALLRWVEGLEPKEIAEQPRHLLDQIRLRRQ